MWQTLLSGIQDGSAWRAIRSSVERAAVGFVLSVVVGVAIGVALAASPLLRRAFGPIITGLQSLPSVAWVPAAIIWFGLTDATMYAVVLLGAVPSIVNGLLAGTDQVPPLFLRVGQVLGARGWTRIRYVLLPAALPGFLGGLKQGWAFAWRSLMAAELITQTIGGGLGQLLDLGRVTNDMSLVIASIFLIFLVGIAIELDRVRPAGASGAALARPDGSDVEHRASQVVPIGGSLSICGRALCHHQHVTTSDAIWTQAHLTLGGHQVFYRRSPDVEGGIPIVHIHGFGISGSYLMPTARLLTDRGANLVPDMPGYGRSERWGHTLGIPALAHALRRCSTPSASRRSS